MRLSVLLSTDMCEIEIGEIDIAESEIQNLQDALQCDYVYEIFDIFKVKEDLNDQDKTI